MLLFLVACATLRLPEPTELMVTSAQAVVPGATLASLVEGRKLTLDHCASCHPPPKPKHLMDPSWPETLDTMLSKAEIGAEQGALIEAYLRASLSTAQP